jgi:hypothetical protein
MTSSRGPDCRVASGEAETALLSSGIDLTIA